MMRCISLHWLSACLPAPFNLTLAAHMCPAGHQDASWAETGDRYLLKLFRDFLFHQSAPEGHPGAGGPLLDWGHVVEALNKVPLLRAFSSSPP